MRLTVNVSVILNTNRNNRIKCRLDYNYILGYLCLYACVSVCVQLCKHVLHVQVKEQFVWINSFFISCMSKKLFIGCHSWWQTSFITEPSHCPKMYLFKEIPTSYQHGCAWQKQILLRYCH